MSAQCIAMVSAPVSHDWAHTLPAQSLLERLHSLQLYLQWYRDVIDARDTELLGCIDVLALAEGRRQTGPRLRPAKSDNVVSIGHQLLSVAAVVV